MTADPRKMICYVCGKLINISALATHQFKCAKIQSPRENDSKENAKSASVKEEYIKIQENYKSESEMIECPHCKRKFLEGRLPIHLKSCTSDHPYKPVKSKENQSNIKEYVPSKYMNKPQDKEKKVSDTPKNRKSEPAIKSRDKETKQIELKRNYSQMLKDIRYARKVQKAKEKWLHHARSLTPPGLKEILKKHKEKECPFCYEKIEFGFEFHVAACRDATVRENEKKLEDFKEEHKISEKSSNSNIRKRKYKPAEIQPKEGLERYKQNLLESSKKQSFCHLCGKQYLPDARFCAFCGKERIKI
ncbi:unnamed protein product [Blepharisma stoltei]|uniref:Zinc-ribbon domain-containing protein n=1 Tax=Blepharisma stoltei TaxID=1481888 RepID=A0AAU9J705_9CILI|nr:unnamed protein product [Blepharisma stoltei]